MDRLVGGVELGSYYMLAIRELREVAGARDHGNRRCTANVYREGLCEQGLAMRPAV